MKVSTITICIFSNIFILNIKEIEGTVDFTGDYWGKSCSNPMCGTLQLCMGRGNHVRNAKRYVKRKRLILRNKFFANWGMHVHPLALSL